jgi:hypothetical protein
MYYLTRSLRQASRLLLTCRKYYELSIALKQKDQEIARRTRGENYDSKR